LPNDDKLPPRNDDGGAQPIPGRAIAAFFLILATALVLGYLLLNKLVDISREEDCILAHRKDCAASMSPVLVGKLRSFPPIGGGLS